MLIFERVPSGFVSFGKNKIILTSKHENVFQTRDAFRAIALFKSDFEVELTNMDRVNQFDKIMCFSGPLFGVSPPPRQEKVLHRLRPCSEK